MAISLVGSGSLGYSTASANRVLSRPSNTQIGDVFHVQIFSQNVTTLANTQGAMVLLSSVNLFGSDNNRVTVLVLVATTAGAGSTTFTLSGSQLGSIAWAQYRGVNAEDPILANISTMAGVTDNGWVAPGLSLPEPGYIVGGASVASGSRTMQAQSVGWSTVTQAPQRVGYLAEYGAHPAGASAEALFNVEPINYMGGRSYQFALRGIETPGGTGPDRGELHQVVAASATDMRVSTGVDLIPPRWTKPSTHVFWQFDGRWDGILPVSGGAHDLFVDLGNSDVVGLEIDHRDNVRPVVAIATNKVAVYRTNSTTPRITTYTYSAGAYTAIVTDAAAPFTVLDHDQSPIGLTYSSNGHLWAAIYEDSTIRVSKSMDDGATWSTPAIVLAGAMPTGIVTINALGTEIVLVASHNGAGQVQSRRIGQSATDLSGTNWTTMDPPSASPAAADDHAASLVVGSSLYVVLKTTEPTGSDPLIYLARWNGTAWTTYPIIYGPDSGDRATRPSIASDGTDLWVVWGHINAPRLSVSSATISDPSTWTAEAFLIPNGDFSDGAITPPAVADVPLIAVHDRSTGSIYTMLLPLPGVGGGAGVPTLRNSWAGIASEGSFTASSRSAGSTSAKLVVATNSALTTGRVLSAAVATDNAGWAKAQITGLADGTWYYGWELTGSEVLATPSQGSFTLGLQSFRFAFGSCMKNSNTTDVFDKIVARDPDMFFHLGDFHYRDNESSLQLSHRADLEMQLDANASLRTLLSTVPNLYIRSDHDAGGGNNAMPGVYTAPNRAAYKQVVPHKPLIDPDGLYYTFVVGRVRFIITDQRYLRTPTSILGIDQLSWLKTQFSQPEPVKIWVLDSTYISDASPQGEDKWSDYAADRNSIRDYIASDGVGQIVAVHGDQHAIAADDGVNNHWGGFPSFCAAPFAQSSSHKASAWSEGIWPTSPSGTTVHQYGTVDVLDDGGDSITITYAGMDTANVSRVTHSLSASSIIVPPDPTETPSWYVYDSDNMFPLELLGRVQDGSVEPGSLWPSTY